MEISQAAGNKPAGTIGIRRGRGIGERWLKQYPGQGRPYFNLRTGRELNGRLHQRTLCPAFLGDFANHWAYAFVPWGWSGNKAAAQETIRRRHQPTFGGTR